MIKEIILIKIIILLELIHFLKYYLSLYKFNSKLYNYSLVNFFSFLILIIIILFLHKIFFKIFIIYL